jgi:ankyrin repeat protein
MAAGSDLNAAASPIGGRTCLQIAAKKSNSDLVQTLLKYGAEVNTSAAAKYGYTAVQAAARSGSLSLVKILLAAGADIHPLATEYGYSAISAAVEGGNLEILQLFLKTANASGYGDQISLLFRASCAGNLEMVHCLIQAGANINARCIDDCLFGDEDTYTAHEAALSEGHTEIFYVLLEASVKVHG